MEYKGKLKKAVPQEKIYLNVDALKKGQYTLKIINKNKTIKQTRFSKK